MKKTSIFIILLASVFTVNAQVKTNISSDRSVLEKVKVVKDNKKAKRVQKFMLSDVQKLLDEDATSEGVDVPVRFGKGFDTNITLSDGNWTTVENGRLWSMGFESLGAYSINFVFNDFYLPEGAELYIANQEETMLYGPVTSKQNTKNGFFLTDLVQGDNVTLYLFEPADKQGQAKLTIKRVVHAYKDLFSNMLYGDYGSSESCHNNINSFPAWDLESDAVALVLLSSGEEHCSGSLLMTTNQSFRPFFLTAFHCIDINANLSLSATEIANAENWMFKFQYKQSYYTGNSRTTGITYNGAAFRAAWNTTDFSLMEMDNSPEGDTDFSWLGWDRSGNIPTSGTGIHHPAGDVMKISFEENQFQTSSWRGSNNHWLLNFDDGVVQHGSSGSPILNQNKRVVGQLHGNQNYNSSIPYCSQPRAEYGRFNLSWTGGGTNDTRLSNWLDPTGTGAMTTNTSRPPTPPSITGSSQEVCGYGTFTLLNPPAGVGTIYWKVSNTNLFSVVFMGNPTRVSVIGSGNDISRLSAHSGSVNGPTLAEIVIVPCTLRVASTAVRAYPNPVSDMLTIDIDRDAFVQAKVAAGQAGIATSRIDPDPVFDIRLLDRYGNVLRSMNTQDSKVQIDATGLSEGMYYLYVYSGKGTKPIIHKIIVGR